MTIWQHTNRYLSVENEPFYKPSQNYLVSVEHKNTENSASFVLRHSTFKNRLTNKDIPMRISHTF